MTGLADAITAAYRGLAEELDQLRFSPPVTHVYNPVRYAWRAHEEYLRRYVAGARNVVLLGMNPGPWGMAQTGVPFGEVQTVRLWLGIEVEVGSPPRQHPARPVEGFACRRREVSGGRLWGWAQQHWGEPRSFFAQFAVLNYCPLMFLTSGGGNFTPDRLPALERRRVEQACDATLRTVVELLSPQLVVGIGAFAHRRAAVALAGSGARVGEILHPSPANPRANRDWAGLATTQLRALGVHVPEGGQMGRKRACE